MTPREPSSIPPSDPPHASHIPVLLNEVIDGLKIKQGDKVIDGTLGGGGHTGVILEKIGETGKLLGLDADPAAIRRVSELHAGHLETGRLTLVQTNFGDIESAAVNNQFEQVDAILFDLGLSSFQLETPERGFSFRNDGPLDMRFDPDQAETAETIINTWDEKTLADIIYRYGEERRSRAIAKRIVNQRPFSSTTELADVIAKAVPRSSGSKQSREKSPKKKPSRQKSSQYRGSKSKIHPATRTFQALRIAVNQELIQLERALTHSLPLLKQAGRIAVISFHSLEDRIVKQWMRDEALTYVRDDTHPLGGYDRAAQLTLISRKPITPGADEINLNPRSRSAKLRIAERV